VFCTETGNNAKQDDHDNPAYSFIVMNEFIPKEGDNERDDCDDDDPDNQRALVIGKSSNNLSTYNRIDHGPVISHDS